MATYKYYLKEETKDGLSLILLVYQEKGKKFKYSTKIKVHKDLWKGKRIKGKTLEVIAQNERLDQYENYIKEIEKEALIKGVHYPIDTVEKKFRFKVSSNPETSEFFAFYDQFMQDARHSKTEGTIKHYGSTKTRLLQFEQWRGRPIKFEEINQYFYESLLNYCISELKLLNNSTGQHVKNLKAFLNYLMNNELVNIKFNLKGFKVFKEDIDIVHLSYDELMKIYHLKDLPQHLEYAKDLFCFECFTGLRFSDVCRVKQENIKGDYLELRTLKTREALIVPLNSYAKEILARYKDRFQDTSLPPAISNQKTNEHLKQIAEIAELDEVLIIEKFSGSRRIEIKKPKYNFISTHTGRRTFITLSYEKGMKPEIIMKITGINKWDTLKKYLKISEKSKLVEMMHYWNKPKLSAI